jgi:predicted sulfurtransferase
VWPSPGGHAFPRLRVKAKPNLISLAGGMERLPVTVAEARATPLEPAAWQTMISDAPVRGTVVLDVRNGYEWDAGHFRGSARPAEEVFNETPVGEGEVDVPEQLRGRPADTPVMMYCTGGIRCDVYSTFLREKGFTNLYTLEGGVQNYLRDNGPDHWNGSLYVFDGRMAIPGDVNDAAAQLVAAVPCQVCGAPGAQLPHMNCANIDCNELFISCAPCKDRYAGCCCAECMSAPRLLRPLKTEGGHYGAWGNYAVGEDGKVRSLARSDGYVQRRARRREVIKAKRERQLEERAARKAMLRRAMASVEVAEAKGEAEARFRA